MGTTRDRVETCRVRYKYIFKLLYGIIVLEGLVKVRFTCSFSTKTPSGAKWAPEGP